MTMTSMLVRRFSLLVFLVTLAAALAALAGFAGSPSFGFSDGPL